MKINLPSAIFLICLSTVSLAQNDWTKVNLGGGKVIDFAFPTESFGYALTDVGQLWKTIDGGLNWTSSQIFSCTNCIFTPRYIFFFSQDEGKVFGRVTTINDTTYLLLSTLDGGNYWDSVTFDLPFNPYQLEFKSTTRAFAYKNVFVGPNQWEYELQLITSDDGGRNWSILNRHNGSGSLSFKDTNTGILSLMEQEPVRRYTYRSANGGKSWDLLNNNIYYKITYVSNGDFYSCYGLGSFERTSDDGASWTTIGTWKDDSLPCFGNIHFLNETLGYYGIYVVDLERTQGKNYGKSTDGGNTWKFGTVGDSGNLVYKIVPVSDKKAFAISGDNLYMTSTGGGFSKVVSSDKTSEVSVKANPVSDHVSFYFQDNPTNKLLEVFDALGRRMATDVIAPQETSYRLDIRSYPAGVYFARLGEKTVRFIKE